MVNRTRTQDDLEEWFVYRNTSVTTIPVSGTHDSPYTNSLDPLLHDRLLRHVALIQTPLDSTGSPGLRMEEKAFRYDTNGRMDRSAVWDGGKQPAPGWLETKFEYDTGSSKPKKITDTEEQRSPYDL